MKNFSEVLIRIKSFQRYYKIEQVHPLTLIALLMNLYLFVGSTALLKKI
jgi:hypothetical protein